MEAGSIVHRHLNSININSGFMHAEFWEHQSQMQFSALRFTNCALNKVSLDITL